MKGRQYKEGTQVIHIIYMRIYTVYKWKYIHIYIIQYIYMHIVSLLRYCKYTYKYVTIRILVWFHRYCNWRTKPLPLSGSLWCVCLTPTMYCVLLRASLACIQIHEQLEWTFILCYCIFCWVQKCWTAFSPYINKINEMREIMGKPYAVFDWRLQNGRGISLAGFAVATERLLQQHADWLPMLCLPKFTLTCVALRLQTF